MNIIALLLSVVMAITPVVTVINIDEDVVFVDVGGESYSFYGEGFEVGEEIRILFIDGVWEVLPW